MTVVGAPAPFRTAFDNARDPYTARNALGTATNPVATAQIEDNAVTNVKLADMVQATVKGRAAGAGTGDPTDLTAAQVGAILAPVWTTYTPTITSQSGTFTTVSAAGRYLTIGKLTNISITINITTNGTAAGFIYASLPHTPVVDVVIGGRETAVTGKACSSINSGATLIIINYDGTYPGTNGARIIMAGAYENP